MAHEDHSYSLTEFLMLEYKLLVNGKIVPDTGATKAHINARLEQIEKELQTFTNVPWELLRPVPDHNSLQGAASDWQDKRTVRRLRPVGPTPTISGDDQASGI